MDTDTQIISDAQWLISNLAARESKWVRSFNRFSNNNRRSEQIYNPYGNPLAYIFTTQDQEVGITPVINVCKSCVDTHISKLMQTKVRPFFNAVNGGFRTRKIIRNTQQFFDQFFVEQSIYSEAIEAARDADVFEVGHLWIDDEDSTIKRIRPWEFYYDRAELQVKRLSRVMLRFRNYPLYPLVKAGKLKKFDELVSLTDSSRTQVVEYIIYYNLSEGLKYELVAGKIINKKKINFSISPVATMYYQTPIKGGYSTSMIDDIYSIQTEIDQTTDTIHQAMTLSPANMIFIPEGSDVKPSMLTNEVGQIIQYNAAGGLSNPITVSAPPAISGQYMEYLKFLEDKAYNMTGVSQLSAQAKKPTGLSSGVALQTLEDVESERNEVPLQNYMKLLMDATKIYITCQDDEKTVLPERPGVTKVIFKDVKAEMAKMTIQYSPSSALSKDPQVKMQQIEKMIAMQMIQPDMAASMMEIPDLEKVYSIETANLDVCERIIERAVELATYDFYETVNIDQLKNLTAFYINRYDANDESAAVIQRLVNLYNSARTTKENIISAVMPPPPPPTPTPVTVVPQVGGPGPIAQGNQIPLQGQAQQMNPMQPANVQGPQVQ